MGLDLAKIDNDALAIASHVEEIRQLGETLIASGLLPNSVRKPESAVAIILKGRELGLPVMQSFDAIDEIQGKMALKPQQMLAMIHASPQCEGVEIDSQEDGCTVTMHRRTHKGVKTYVESFTGEDARRMGLAGKDNYKKQPRTMYTWRAIGRCARLAFPDVIQNMYTPDEVLEVVERERAMNAQADDATDVEYRPATKRLAEKLQKREEPTGESESPPPPAEAQSEQSAQQVEAPSGSNGEPELTPRQKIGRFLSAELIEASDTFDADDVLAFLSWLLRSEEAQPIAALGDLTREDSEAVFEFLGDGRFKYGLSPDKLAQRLDDWNAARAMAEGDGAALFPEEQASA